MKIRQIGRTALIGFFSKQMHDKGLLYIVMLYVTVQVLGILLVFPKTFQTFERL